MTYRCMGVGCASWKFGHGCGHPDRPDASSDWVRHTEPCPRYVPYSAANLYLQDRVPAAPSPVRPEAPAPAPRQLVLL